MCAERRDWPDPAIVASGTRDVASPRREVLPAIEYAPRRTGLAGAGLLVLGILIALYNNEHDVGAYLIAAGVAGFGGSKLVKLRRRLATGDPAVGRKGDLIVSAQLVEPLPLVGTTFEIRNNDDDAIVVVLRHDGQEHELATDGWKIPGERFVEQRPLDLMLRQLEIERYEP